MYGDYDAPEPESRYDTAEICLNGHVISDAINEFPVHHAEFCARCGEATITKCPKCETGIRGHYFVPGVIGGYHFEAPAFCHKCGQAYPWTQRGLEAARELADLSENLSDDEKKALKASLDDLVKESPRTKVAEARFKQLMKKGGKDIYEGMRSILVDIASEAVKKSLFGPGA